MPDKPEEQAKPQPGIKHNIIISYDRMPNGAISPSPGVYSFTEQGLDFDDAEAVMEFALSIVRFNRSSTNAAKRVQTQRAQAMLNMIQNGPPMPASPGLPGAPPRPKPPEEKKEETPS